MGVRGELFTTQVTLDNRAYFFNVKENRSHDVFLQIVESKKNGDDEQRLQIAVFEDDMQKFLQGLDLALSFINKNHKEIAKQKAKYLDDKIKKRANFLKDSDTPSLKKSKNIIKKTGKIHIVSKKPKSTSGDGGDS